MFKNYFNNKFNLFSTNSNNINTNYLIEDFKNKIINNLFSKEYGLIFNSFVVNKLTTNKIDLINNLHLEEICNNNKPLLFNSKAPQGFTEVFQYAKLPGIYWFYSTLSDHSSYIGHTTNLYQRLNNHKNNALNQPQKHPKLYNYVNKYGWETIEIRVITLIPKSELSFKQLYPNYILSEEQIKLLDLLTKYDLLVAEQYCIDTIKPNLNLDLIVNAGGLPNKGASGYIVSNEELLRRSQNLKNRKFSENTIELLRKSITGRTFSQETKDKMSLSSGGVKVYLYSSDYLVKKEFKTKSELADFLGISLRTLSRRIKDSKSIIKNNITYFVSLDPNLKQ